MLKRTIFLLTFFISACVTVNIYFPAAAVERAADQIVKETWGRAGRTGKTSTQAAEPQFNLARSHRLREFHRRSERSGSRY